MCTSFSHLCDPPVTRYTIEMVVNFLSKMGKEEWGKKSSLFSIYPALIKQVFTTKLLRAESHIFDLCF